MFRWEVREFMQGLHRLRKGTQHWRVTRVWPTDCLSQTTALNSNKDTLCPTLYCLWWCGTGAEVYNITGKMVYFVLLCCLSKHILTGLQRLSFIANTAFLHKSQCYKLGMTPNAAAFLHNEEEIGCEGNKHYTHTHKKEEKLQSSKKIWPFIPARSQASSLE